MFQSLFSKAALALAGGALVLTTASGTALATQSTETDTTAETRAASSAPADVDASRLFHGRVISKLPLNVRAHPGLKGRVIGSVKPGTQVKIVCKVNSTVIDGNPRWYKILFKKHQGWVSARYVKNIGPAPHFC